MKKFGIAVVVLIGVVLIFVLYVDMSYNRTFDPGYPSVTVSDDSAVLARGEYLVYGPAHCANCHISIDQFQAVEAGEKVPLTGGFSINMPLGKFYAPNITMDPETGIGKMSNEELARALRYNVNHRGEAMMPFMPFMNMSQDDLNAVISYLRQTKAVKNEVPPVEYSFMGKLIKRFALEPTPLSDDIPQSVSKDDKRVYGEYMAYSVANCYGCHTELDEKTGKYVGEPFAGGMRFPSEFVENRTYYTPNLTPDKETGIMASWSEEQFVTRMKSGRVHEDSPMPWGPFSRMTDYDLSSIYAFISNLEPVNNEIANIVVDEE